METITIKGRAIEVTPDVKIPVPFYYKTTGFVQSVNRIYRNKSGDLRKMSIHLDTSTGTVLHSDLQCCNLEQEIEKITREDFERMFDLMIDMLIGKAESLRDEMLEDISVGKTFAAVVC